jgi:DNA-binding transcriptional MerR regulator
MTETVTAAVITLGIHNTERELGITYRRLDWWVRLGYLHPLHLGGSGNPREWTRAELDVARIMGRLVAAGLSLETAHRIARSRDPRCEIADGIYVDVTR